MTLQTITNSSTLAAFTAEISAEFERAKRKQKAENDGHDSIELVDYKTNSHGGVPTNDSLRSHLPTFLYWLLARKKYPHHQAVRFTYLNVLTLAASSVEYTGEEMAANKQALWEAIKGIGSSEFQPKPSSDCSWCDYRDECPAANQVVDFDEI